MCWSWWGRDQRKEWREIEIPHIKEGKKQGMVYVAPAILLCLIIKNFPCLKFSQKWFGLKGIQISISIKSSKLILRQIALIEFFVKDNLLLTQILNYLDACVFGRFVYCSFAFPKLSNTKFFFLFTKYSSLFAHWFETFPCSLTIRWHIIGSETSLWPVCSSVGHNFREISLPFYLKNMSTT